MEAPAHAVDHSKLKLILRCALSAEMIATIGESQKTMGVDFCETALRLGMASAEDVAAARNQQQGISRIQRKRLVPGNELMLVRDPYSRHSEKIRALRTSLLLRRGQAGQADCLALLSPSAGEGRSHLAAELAIAFAQLGQPTLLVDADLRQPSQHLLFRTDYQQGLADALAHGAEPFLHPVDGVPQLSLLTAGSPQPNPLELLTDGRLEQMIETWRSAFTFVVMDTSPCDRYSDGLAVASMIGRVLIVARAHHTTYRNTNDLLRGLSATQSQILGAVINHF
jgi:receptor protein-tyrosine kinase